MKNNLEAPCPKHCPRRLPNQSIASKSNLVCIVCMWVVLMQLFNNVTPLNNFAVDQYFDTHTVESHDLHISIILFPNISTIGD